MKTDADKLRSFLKQVAPTLETYGKKSIVSEIDEAITTTEDSATVLFCGEFKRGKSSLVNAIIGAELCPTDTGIATSVITTIKYGAVKKAVRYYGNILDTANAISPDSFKIGESPVPTLMESLKSEEIEWGDIQKYTMGDVLDIDNTVLVELSYPCPFLKNGITIIDTPGIGGLDPRHAILTHVALPKADVIVFVTDAGEPLTQSELEFYESKVLSCGKRNVVLVNKSDILTADTLATHVSNTKLQLAKLGGPEVIPVSAKCWELYSKLEENDFLLSSNKDAVLAGITSEVETFKKTQYKKYRDMLIAEIDDVYSAISLEIQQLKKDSNDKIKVVEDLQRQQAALSKFRGDLNNPTSQIRLQINSIFEDARNEVQNLISHDGTLLTSTEFDALLESERGLENEGKWFVAQINDRLQNLSREVDCKIECAFNEISKAIGKDVNKGIMNVEGKVLSCKLDQHDKFARYKDKDVFRLVSSGLGKIMQGGLLGGITGGLVGVAIPALATSLAPIVGFATIAAFTWKGLKTDSVAAKKMYLRQHLLPKINLAITDMRNQANTRFSKFHQNLLLTLQTIIGETEDKMRTLQTSIQESRTSEHQAKEKIAELEQKSKFCETITSQMKLLYSNPFTNAQ